MLLQSDKSVEGLPEARKKTSPTASWVMSLNVFCVLSLCVPASQLLYLDVCFFFFFDAGGTKRRLFRVQESSTLLLSQVSEDPLEL